jgi:oligoribonuclease NrnB/cAMP/cGMP phosphodiesterase (DHH superfamily)
LDNELRSVIVSRGGTYVDVLPAFRNIPNTEQGFFPLEGHPNAQGHAMISALLAEELTSGAAPAIAVVASQNAVLEQGR